MAKRLDMYIGSTLIGYTQKADINEELSNDTLPTFSGPVPDMGADPTYEVSCDLLRYEGTLESFLKVKQVIRSTKDTPQNIKIVEQVVFASKETAKVTQLVYNCSLTSNKLSFDPETRTVSNLTWKGTKLKEYANGKEII